MNLLMVSPFFPSPSSGARTRVYHLLKALAREYSVSLVVLTADAHEAEDGVPEGMKLKRFLKVPWPTFPPKRVQHVLDDLVARDHYEVALFESAFMAGYRLPQDTRVIIDEHNIEYELLYRTYQRENSLVRKWYNWWESRQIKPVELERCGNAQGVLVTSEREAVLLKALLPDSMIAVVPNGVA